MNSFQFINSKDIRNHLENIKKTEKNKEDKKREETKKKNQLEKNSFQIGK